MSVPTGDLRDKGNVSRSGERERVYDLEERTARFGENIIGFAKTIANSPVTASIIDQLVRAGTSVGANYCEADDACSRKDFRHKMSICRKEARESKHRLRMSAAAAPDLAEDARKLWQEAKELHLIFVAIIRKTDANTPKNGRQTKRASK